MKRISIALVLLSAAAVEWAYYRPVPTEAATQVQPVAKEAHAIVAPGRVEPLSEEVAIGSEIDGRLAQVLVEEGQSVRKGQVLATLVNGDYAARVQLAESLIAERRAELERLHNGARDQERREAMAFVDEAKAVLDQARTERDRRQFLLDKGAISRTEFEMAVRDFNVASARVEATRQRASFVQSDTRIEDIRRAEAEIASAEARAAEARAILAKTVIVSPINGVVLRKHQRTGENVSAQASSPILTLGDTSRLRVRVDVDETDVARITAGQTVVIKAAAFGERTFTGTVSRVGQILGKKNIRTGDPSERVDTKVLETLVDLEPGSDLPVGLRVDAYIGL
ncbi:MAG: HlyD family efflux transporter periplasmic adaptor subunit [Bryobacteraceae bacterium]